MTPARVQFKARCEAIALFLNELAADTSRARDNAAPTSEDRTDIRGATRYLEKALTAIECAIERLEG